VLELIVGQVEVQLLVEFSGILISLIAEVRDVLDAPTVRLSGKANFGRMEVAKYWVIALVEKAEYYALVFTGGDLFCLQCAVQQIAQRLTDRQGNLSSRE